MKEDLMWFASGAAASASLALVVKVRSRKQAYEFSKLSLELLGGLLPERADEEVIGDQLERLEHAFSNPTTASLRLVGLGIGPWLWTARGLLKDMVQRK